MSKTLPLANTANALSAGEASAPLVNPPEQPKDDLLEFSKLLGSKQFIRTNQGLMTHLYTSVVFSTVPRRATIDQFLLTQLEAKKLIISEDE